MPGKSNKLTIPRVALYAAVAIASFILLRFVFSVAMSAMKFIFLGALAVLVVYLFLGKDKGSTDGGGSS